MMFFIAHNNIENFEEEEEEDLDEALLGDLDDALIDDDALLEDELPPTITEADFGMDDGLDTLKEDADKLFAEDEEEDEDADYDSFDDRDEF